MLKMIIRIVGVMSIFTGTILAPVSGLAYLSGFYDAVQILIMVKFMGMMCMGIGVLTGIVTDIIKRRRNVVFRQSDNTAA